MTDGDIQDLILVQKTILAKSPSSGYRQEGGHNRCDLELQAASDGSEVFTVFIRQHSRFIENFSIGLRYRTGDRTLGTIPLVRYNGPHGETSRQPDGHYSNPHIHRVTSAEIASGNIQPQERHRERTDRYNTFDQALAVFFNDIAASNYMQYFPEVHRPRLFNELG